MLVFEALDSIALGACKEKANHHVVKASIDEVVDNRSQLGLPAELLEQAHLGDYPEPMSPVDQVARSRLGP
jgi:hypothetical protein